MHIPKKFALQLGMKNLRVEYDSKNHAWRVWLYANNTFSIGTFLLLHNNGAIHRITIRQTGEEEVFIYEEGNQEESSKEEGGFFT